MRASLFSRLALLTVALCVAAAACGSSSRAGPGGTPPLAPQDDWARERVEAVLAFYNFTEGGKDAVRRMQVHHVLGRPGWFGSTGHGNWVGIGQARPSSIVHEISHSFWGAFPIEGRPELTWSPRPGEGVSAGIAALRRDLDAFLKQPPDAYEPLRGRLRQIPDLTSGDFPGLYHLGEAEIVHFTGGDFNLAPPILRKYYKPWLKPGPLHSWDEAARRYLSLPREQRRLSDAFAGFGAMDLAGYRIEVDPQARVDPGMERLVVQEERQRLRDFLEQFELYFQPIDGPPVANDSRFWRGYLREMAQLHRRYPDALGGADPRARRIREALELVSKAESLPPGQRVPFAREQVSRTPFLLKFIAALDHPTLAELIAPQTGGEGRIASRVRDALEPDYRLYLATATSVLGTLKERPEAAAQAFDSFIGGLEKRQRQQMNFILEVFNSVDRGETRRLLPMASPETALLMVKHGPAFTRFLTEPEALITALGYGGELSPERLIELAQLFNERVSAVRSVDAPFQDAVYRRIIALSRAPGGGSRLALEVFSESGLLVEPFLLRFPEEASALVLAETALAAEVFRVANPVRLPPARAIYRLIQADPAAAARLTLQYQRMGRRDIVLDALAFFAYDATRLRRQPGLSISLEKDSRYLLELAQGGGDGWLRDAVAAMRERVQKQVTAGDLDPGVLEAWQETVGAGLVFLSEPERHRLASYHAPTSA